MMMNKNISLGVDISEDFISFALLKKGASGITLQKAGRVETPSQCVSQGNITDHAWLAKTIKEMLSRHRVKASSLAVSLFAQPTLSQIFTLPEETPSNIDTYIHGEIKNSMMLVGQEYCYDYCLLSKNAKSSESKVITQAASVDHITPVVKTLNRASMPLTAIELPAHAWIRAAYDETIANNYDRNTLVFFSRSSQTHISVFRKGHLDFVRTLDFDCKSVPLDEFVSKTTRELKAVIQYYDIEVETENSVGWQILLHLNNCQCGKDVQHSLAEQFNHDIQLCTGSNINSKLLENYKNGTEEISTVAVGLALRKLRTVSENAMINLIPRNIAQINSLKRSAMLVVNFAVAVIVAIFLLTDIQAAKAVDVDKVISEKYRTNPAESISGLAEQQRNLTDQIKNLKQMKDAMGQLQLDNQGIKWSAILDHISQNVSDGICITDMIGSANNTISLHGISLTYETPYFFVNRLIASDYIDSAAVTETNTHPDDKNMITYRIDCLIDSKGGAVQNVN